MSTYIRFVDDKTGEFNRVVRIECQAKSVYERLAGDAQAMGLTARWGEEADWTNGLAFKLYPCYDMDGGGYTQVTPPDAP